MKQRNGPGYPGNEFWNYSKQHYLVYKCIIYANRSEITSWTATLTPEVEIESCPDYPRAFPFWNDVLILLLNHSISRNENPQREDEVDSSSFEGFHTQLDCKLTYGIKNQTQLTLV